MVMKIPVFVSAPTQLNPQQQTTYDQLIGLLDRENFERRALGRSDYPSELPLREVVLVARHCSGGVILGFSQFETKAGEWKVGTPTARKAKNVKFPTAWNHLEAGILFGLQLPLMVFHEEGVEGGVFDKGVTDVFVNKLPLGGFTRAQRTQLIAAIQSWAAKVRDHYRRWDK